MKVTLAKSAGFCFGVKRAVEMVYKEAETGKKVYTLGPIIHNEQVVQDLEQKGVRVIDTPEELSKAEDATVIIRSHGISADVYHQLEDKKVRIVDATCPFVSKIHRIVEKKYQEGSCIVIVGNANHPEVEGINGWCNGAATVIGSVSEAENYSQEPARKLCVVAQTTFNYKKFKDIVDVDDPATLGKFYSDRGADELVFYDITASNEERKTSLEFVKRVAEERNMSEKEVQDIIDEVKQKRVLGFFGETYVNVVELNLKLDEVQNRYRFMKGIGIIMLLNKTANYSENEKWNITFPGSGEIFTLNLYN